VTKSLSIMLMEEEKAIEKALEAAKEWASILVEEPLGELGGILSDTIGYWRLKNQINILLKAK